MDAILTQGGNVESGSWGRGRRVSVFEQVAKNFSISSFHRNAMVGCYYRKVGE